jgi:DNA repair protein RecN (Recombination protein N)
MIVELTVENLAIIERSHLSLGPGFTVLTGETGAGKSLLIDAIELALGERADTELVRTGARSATVDVVLDLSARPEVLAKCLDLGIPIEDGALFIHREVFAEGRSQCRIAGKLAPVSQLRLLGQYLVDLHGQHDHQSLLDPERHIGFLDLWIGQPATDLLTKVQQAFEQADEARKRLNSLRAGLRDREQRLDMLRFQIGEIEAVSPAPDEMPDLESQLGRLKYAEKLSLATASALAGLTDEEGCAQDKIGIAVKTLEDAVRFDPALEDILIPIRDALYQLEEASHSLREYNETLESDPARLEEVAGRIDSLKRLRRKYGDDEQAVLDFLEQSRQELVLLEDSEASEDELVQRVEQASQQLRDACGQLTYLRKERAKVFGDLVQTQLRDLAMDRALFSVEFRPKEPQADGADQVEFYFSANAGEPPRPLSKIASGGEISRVMLAIKTALAGKAGVPTLIFDEVDAGLSGRAASTVAAKLEELARHYQVVVITHLPQIASRADTHYRIEKVEQQGRVITQVRPLSLLDREEEIARMLTGERITQTALANARELLSGSA